MDPFSYECHMIEASIVGSAGPPCQGSNSIPAISASHAAVAKECSQSLMIKAGLMTVLTGMCENVMSQRM